MPKKNQQKWKEEHGQAEGTTVKKADDTERTSGISWGKRLDSAFL